MDGDAILQRMLATYASCRSYRDIGEVHEVLTSGDEPPQVWKLRKPFQTGFVRPLSFVFECFVDALSERADRKPYVVWSNERGARSWPNRGRAAVAVHTHASLEEPLALAAGPSGGSSATVPSMLLGLASRWTRGDVRFDLEAVDDIDGRACHRLQSARFGPAELMWIDCERHVLVRRYLRLHSSPEASRRQRAAALADPSLPADLRRDLEQSASSPEPSLTTETTTYYRPELDVEIEAGAFDVRPPE